MQKSWPPCQRGSFELQHMLWLLPQSFTGRRLSSKGSNSYTSLVTWPFLKENKVRVLIFRLMNTIPKTTVDTREELLVTETSSRNLIGSQWDLTSNKINACFVRLQIEQHREQLHSFYAEYENIEWRRCSNFIEFFTSSRTQEEHPPSNSLHFIEACFLSGV